VALAQVVGASENGAFYIDKGENSGVFVGQRYEVYRVVDEIRDASGNLLDTITDRVGMLEVTRVLGQSSISTVVEGARPLKAIRWSRFASVTGGAPRRLSRGGTQCLTVPGVK
jgi:hypothetical protein